MQGKLLQILLKLLLESRVEVGNESVVDLQQEWRREEYFPPSSGLVCHLYLELVGGSHEMVWSLGEALA